MLYMDYNVPREKTLKNAKYTDYGLYTVKYSPGTLLVEEL